MRKKPTPIIDGRGCVPLHVVVGRVIRKFVRMFYRLGLGCIACVLVLGGSVGRLG